MFVCVCVCFNGLLALPAISLVFALNGGQWRRSVSLAFACSSVIAFACFNFIPSLLCVLSHTSCFELVHVFLPSLIVCSRSEKDLDANANQLIVKSHFSHGRPGPAGRLCLWVWPVCVVLFPFVGALLRVGSDIWLVGWGWLVAWFALIVHSYLFEQGWLFHSLSVVFLAWLLWLLLSWLLLSVWLFGLVSSSLSSCCARCPSHRVSLNESVFACFSFLALLQSMFLCINW